MNSKNPVKTRYARNNKVTDPIIEIKEPINRRTKVYQKRKDYTENTSSEATTPNKKGIKKKKIDEELIEIVEPEKKKETKYSKRKENAKPSKKKDKAKNKSVDKIRKNNNYIKREKRMMSITLNETDVEDENEEEEINITSTPNRPIRKNIRHEPQQKRNISRTPDKKNKKKNKSEFSFPKNPRKKSKRIKETKMTQYELTSSSEENNIDETQNRAESKKSRSMIKASKENTALLGKKRKNERNVKSKTPNKMNKTQIRIVNKVPIEIKNSPIKMRAGKSSKTPVKNNSKKIRNMFPVDSGSSNNVDSKNYVTPELAVLNQLIVEFGFEKVLDSLCKAKLNNRNKLDSCVQGLRDSCTNEKLPLFLIKMLFSYFEKKEKEQDTKEKIPEKPQEKLTVPQIVTGKEEIKENEKEKKEEKKEEKEKDNKKSTSMLKSTSAENTNTNNELNEFSEKQVSKSPIISHSENIFPNISSPMVIEEQTSAPIHLTEEEPSPQNTEKKEKKNPPIPISEIKKLDKTPVKSVKDEVKKEKKNMSIGSHYHKDEDGLIYKYQVYKLDGKGNAIFKCYDDRCKSEGTYDLDSRKFGISVKHSLKHQEHDYIMNYDKGEDNVFKEMSNLNKNDAQVFKEGNERTVKIY